MKVYGYKRKGNKCIELREASLYCSIEELDEIIRFLQYAREKHNEVRTITPVCHSHYRDWDKTWKEDETDIILVTPFD